MHWEDRVRVEGGTQLHGTGGDVICNYGRPLQPCLCVHRSTHARMWEGSMCIHVEHRGQLWVSFLRWHSPCFWDRISLWSGTSRSKQSTLAGHSPRELPIFLPSNEIVTMVTTAASMDPGWMNSGLHAYMAKHFIGWVTPRPFYNILICDEIWPSTSFVHREAPWLTRRKYLRDIKF